MGDIARRPPIVIYKPNDARTYQLTRLNNLLWSKTQIVVAAERPKECVYVPPGRQLAVAIHVRMQPSFNKGSRTSSVGEKVSQILDEEKRDQRRVCVSAAPTVAAGSGVLIGLGGLCFSQWRQLTHYLLFRLFLQGGHRTRCLDHTPNLWVGTSNFYSEKSSVSRAPREVGKVFR